MMKILRVPLAEEKTTPRLVAGYDPINHSTAKKFVEDFAKQEAEARSGIKCVRVSDESHPVFPERILHKATLIGTDDKPLVEFVGVWPSTSGGYDLPDNTANLNEYGLEKCGKCGLYFENDSEEWVSFYDRCRECSESLD